MSCEVTVIVFGPGRPEVVSRGVIYPVLTEQGGGAHCNRVR